jgi:hypothetical protein
MSSVKEGSGMSESMQPQITGKIMMYERPELLNREAHGALGISRPKRPFGFCAKLRAAPITIGELSLAARHYPIIFSHTANIVPLAVLGVIDDFNLFIDDAGNWEKGVYVPAFVRRYPFAVANENGGDKFAIVIDAAHEGVVAGAEFPFFKDGGLTEETERAIEFCRQYEGERRQTEQVMKSLESFQLISPQSAMFTPEGKSEQQPFAEYFGADASKLQAMPDDKFLELRRSGLLPLIHVQLSSMINWRELLARRAERFSLANANVLKPINLN